MYTRCAFSGLRRHMLPRMTEVALALLLIGVLSTSGCMEAPNPQEGIQVTYPQTPPSTFADTLVTSTTQPANPTSTIGNVAPTTSIRVTTPTNPGTTASTLPHPTVTKPSGPTTTSLFVPVKTIVPAVDPIANPATCLTTCAEGQTCCGGGCCQTGQKCFNEGKTFVCCADNQMGCIGRVQGALCCSAGENCFIQDGPRCCPAGQTGCAGTTASECCNTYQKCDGQGHCIWNQ